MKLALFFLSLITLNVIAILDPNDVYQKTKLPMTEIVATMRYLDDLERECDGDWGIYYHVLPRLINEYNLEIGCEIGVSLGSHCKRILETTNVKKLYGIDPYINYNDPTNVMLSNNKFEIFYLRVVEKLSKFGQRFELIREYSLNATSHFADSQLDFIFLDANHTYNAVKEDLENWWPKIRPGGIMAGDDYATRHPGVPQAVNEFVQKNGLTLLLDKQQPRIWWIVKP